MSVSSENSASSAVADSLPAPENSASSAVADSLPAPEVFPEAALRADSLPAPENSVLSAVADSLPAQEIFREEKRLPDLTADPRADLASRPACAGELPLLPDAGGQPQWFALYTRANQERRVARQLEARGVEHFLPLYRSRRRWKDRHVFLDLPLFPGYLFARFALPARQRVLEARGVVRLVGFHGSPTAMPEEDVNRIREFLGQGWRAEPHPYLQAGRRARALRGPLAGMEGIVVRRKNRSRLVLSFEAIQRSVAVEMDEGDLAAV